MQERWHARCQSLRVWVNANTGKLPKYDETLPCGFLVGVWLFKQRGRLAKGRLEQVQISDLDDAAPGWRSEIVTIPESLHKHPSTTELDRNEAYHAIMRELAAFIAEYGRFPRCGGVPDTDEYWLGKWLVKQRSVQSRGRLSTERAESLDSTVPGWRNGVSLSQREQRWRDSL